MQKYIAILRGINVGANRKVPMADLNVLLTKLGLENIQTYIQSGNIIFESAKPESISDLEDRLHKSISETFGFDIPVLVREAGEIGSAIAENPFLKEKEADIEKLHLTFLKDVPAPEMIAKTEMLQFHPDQYKIIGTNVFIYCENGYGRTKITNDFFERKLKVSATTRNWKTVLKLHELSNVEINAKSQRR